MPEWWNKSSKGKKASANVAENKTAEKDEPDFTMLATTFPDDETALTCTSDFHSKAHATSNHHRIIIDSGASRHFSPDRSKFLNYQKFIN